jgi:hypothetical protein
LQEDGVVVSNRAEVRGAHLVGSVPLAGAAEVFKFVSNSLRHHAKRIPDGETGARINWTEWQLDVFKQVEAFESEVVDSGYIKRAKFRLRRDKTAKDVVFPPLGYAKAVRESFPIFKSLKQAGIVPGHMKFQVCLPTPIAPTVIYVFPQHQLAIEPRYEAAMLSELDDILTVVPAGELAFQWDTAIEFAIIEGSLPHSFKHPEVEMVSRLIRLGNHVPPTVELGFHLCYGDSGGRHFKEPQDTSKLVTVANSVNEGLRRPLNWLHLPVPIDRVDQAYYAPLAKLELSPETELYLGLVHDRGGVPGTLARIESASRYVKRFGVSTECGLGRRPPKTLPELMKIHVETSSPIDEPAKGIT